MKLGKNITTYGCGHQKESEERFGEDKFFSVSYPCYDCQQAMIGTRQNVVRYGEIPEDGKSYNFRENRAEDGVSCYLTSMRPRPEFVENRKRQEFSAIIIGWGGDDEPLIDAKSIIY